MSKTPKKEVIKEPTVVVEKEQGMELAEIDPAIKLALANHQANIEENMTK